jgi:hypothetical protein
LFNTCHLSKPGCHFLTAAPAEANDGLNAGTLPEQICLHENSFCKPFVQLGSPFCTKFGNESGFGFALFRVSGKKQ